MRYGFAVLLVVELAGCGVEVLTTTAIQGELQSQQLQAMKRQVGGVADSAAKANLRKAIDTFQAEKGYYPLTLSSLVPDYLPSLPKRADGTPFDYDATTGRLLDGPVAPGLAGSSATSQGPSDEQRMAQIRAAIDRYGQATGYYPPSLQALVPQYLAEVPKTVSGQDFIFYPQNGGLYVPGQVTYASPPQPNVSQPAPQGRGVPVGGSGPMGEVMTGIGVQQQLNSMSSAGTSSAGSYSRQAIGSTTDQYNQRQSQALDELGQ